MITNFDIEQNLKVEFLVPDALGGIFTLGISILDGTDVLGGFNEFIIDLSLLGGDDVLAPSKGLAWQEVNCSTSDATIDIGGSLLNSITFQPEPATANITLQSFDFDPTVNKNIRASTKIRIRLESQDVDRIIFQGYINTINVTYYPEGLNLIQITAFDVYRKLVNTRFPIWDTTPYGPPVFSTFLFELIADQAGLGISGLSRDIKGIFIPEVNETNVIVADILNEVILASNAIVWIDQDTEELAYIPRVPQDPFPGPPAPEFTIGNNHPAPGVLDPSHLCLGEISVFSDQDAVFNSLRVTLESDDTQVLEIKDQDSIDLYGESPVDVTLNAFDLNEMGTWAENVFEDRSANLVNQVVTPALDRLGTLTNAAVFTPGTRINVSYTKNQLNIVGIYTVIKVSHRIDVDNWFTTLELWKEA
jgi:hypothetical protein